jgi:pimeloyl-ACP methyl ester carboxylesterase
MSLPTRTRSIVTTYSKGLYRANEGLVFKRPKQGYVAGSKTGVIQLHGSGSGALDNTDDRSYIQTNTNLVNRFATTRPVACVDAGGETWGNDTAMSAIDDAYTWLTGAGGGKPGKVVIYGGSMGACNTLNWVKRNPTKVACAIVIIPVTDLNDIHDRSPNGLAAPLNAAYSGGYQAARDAATHSPYAFRASLAGTRLFIYTSTGDTIALSTPALAVADAVGPTATVQTGTEEHGLLTTADLDCAALETWVDTYAQDSVPTKCQESRHPQKSPPHAVRSSVCSRHTGGSNRSHQGRSEKAVV